MNEENEIDFKDDSCDFSNIIITKTKMWYTSVSVDSKYLVHIHVYYIKLSYMIHNFGERATILCKRNFESIEIPKKYLCLFFSGLLEHPIVMIAHKNAKDHWFNVAFMKTDFKTWLLNCKKHMKRRGNVWINLKFPPYDVKYSTQKVVLTIFKRIIVFQMYNNNFATHVKKSNLKNQIFRITVFHGKQRYSKIFVKHELKGSVEV